MPSDPKINYVCEAVWNSITFERMQSSLDKLEKDEKAVSAYIYHKLMGHDADEVLLNVTQPSRLSAPGLPELNHSQMNAVKTVLTRPLSLIQGPPGTGKVCHFVFHKLIVLDCYVGHDRVPSCSADEGTSPGLLPE